MEHFLKVRSKLLIENAHSTIWKMILFYKMLLFPLSISITMPKGIFFWLELSNLHDCFDDQDMLHSSIIT